MKRRKEKAGPKEESKKHRGERKREENVELKSQKAATERERERAKTERERKKAETESEKREAETEPEKREAETERGKAERRGRVKVYEDLLFYVYCT